MFSPGRASNSTLLNYAFTGHGGRAPALLGDL
jgi:hypothetical protein